GGTTGGTAHATQTTADATRGGRGDGRRRLPRGQEARRAGRVQRAGERPVRVHRGTDGTGTVGRTCRACRLDRRAGEAREAPRLGRAHRRRVRRGEGAAARRVIRKETIDEPDVDRATQCEPPARAGG